ncbi:MAG: excinuclease ABC subunit UvrC [Candidatus Sumerlaeia bacterium]|nr:excinuclease ABC subunit UvrC [Candidatus Sumerlaeia bacterium]
MTSITDEFLANLPTNPGVYIMKDARDTVIYVGKAKSLRSRVRSYFREGGDGRYTVSFLVNRVAAIETILTENEKEALLLENTLIKKHKPRYNVRLRDDKTYLSLRFDLGHKWPRLHPTRRRNLTDKAQYFGPYSSGASMKETIRFLQRLFPIRSCSDHELESRVRPCILHQIERCCAPCAKPVDPAEYRQYVDQTLLFLKGKQDEVIRILEKRMLEYSELMLFEKAALVRDQIQKLRQTVEVQNTHSHRSFNRDVVGMCREGGKIGFMVLSYVRGKLDGNSTYTVRDTDLSDGEVLEGFLSQFYDTTRPVPLDILIPAEVDNRELLEELLAAQRDGGGVHLRVPQRGEKKRLMELAQKNARAVLERALAGQKTIEETLESLQGALGLPRIPRHIECFDISNFQGAFSVGSMVCFKNAEPFKAGYKRFRIKNVEGQNDFAMMNEVLTRQYKRVQEGEIEAPDLIVIDGGIAQLNVAVEVLASLGLLEKIPVVGMAKSRRKGAAHSPHEEKTVTEERIFLPGRKNPVTFRRADAALRLLVQIRDETHRFGVKYHRLLREKNALKTGLEEVAGLGEKRLNVLLEHFGSLRNVQEASWEEMREVKSLPEKVLRSVYELLHPEELEDLAEEEEGEETEGEIIELN